MSEQHIVLADKLISLDETLAPRCQVHPLCIKTADLGPRLPNQTVVLRIMGAIPAEARGPQRAEGLMQQDCAWHCPDETSHLAA